MHQSSLSLTLKVRLYPTSKQSRQFEAVTETYRQACNIISQWFFDQYFAVNRKKFNHDQYYYLKSLFPKLNTAMVQSVYRTVDARYKSIDTQLKKQPLYVPSGNFDKHGKEKWMPIQRNKYWLQKPIHFKRPQADYLRNTNYRFGHQSGLLSLNVLSQRIKVPYNDCFNDILFDNDVNLGTAKLVKSCGHWFLHVPFAKTITIPDRDDFEHVVGIDRGLRFITTTFDETGQTKFVNGKHLIYVRRKYKYLRQQLQRRKTSSARRRLKKIGQRENRYVTDMNHQLSKALVDYYGKNTLFVIEDLSGIRHVTKRTSKDKRYERVSWSFYDLGLKLAYKAQLNQSLVIEVVADYTSQRCPKCGRINKDNRNHNLHCYCCDRCGYRSNDDRIGAMNIYELGKQWRSDVKNPHFVKLESDD